MLRHFMRKGGWIALVALAIGLTALWVWREAGRDARDLASRGMPVAAEVVALDHHVTALPTGGDTTRRRESFTVTVSDLPPGAAAPLTATRNVTEAFFATLTRGQALEIVVLPDDPAVIEVELGWVAGNATAAGWVGGVTTALGLAILPLFLTLARRAAALDRRGVTVPGEIIARIPSGKAVTLVYSFVPRGGVPVKGSATLSVRAPGADRPVGTTVGVCHDPDDPSRSRLL